MGSRIKNIAKAGLLFAAVGALLALAAPVVAGAMGIAPAALGTSANPMWMGAFFGMFGAINATITPVIDKVFGDDLPKPAIQAAHHPHVTVVLQPSVEKSHQQEVSGSKYRETIQAERTAIKAEKSIDL